MNYLKKYDVIVVGGGPAGIMAALASSRNGAKTLIIERGSYLGGTATHSVIGPISPFHHGDEQVIGGLPQEFIEELVKTGGATGHMKCINPFGTGSYICVYDHDKYKYVAQEILLKSNVDILFHSIVFDVKKNANTINGVKIISKFGKHEFDADIIVDATGDGDVAVLAGEEYSYGNQKEQVQPSSSMFEMSGVDIDGLYEYISDNKEEFSRLSDLISVREDNAGKEHRYFVAQGYHSLVREAVSKGELVFGRNSVHTIVGFRPGCVHFNTARIRNDKTTDLFMRSASEIDGRRQIESIANFMIKYVPGFEKAYVSRTSNEVGVRESRHIKGVYTLTGEDVVGGRKFKDVISRGCFAIDIHGAGADMKNGRPIGSGGEWHDLKDAYDIPYRCLIPKTVDGLILAGRCISGTAEAHSSFRTQGTVMGLSQASGTAAALCIKHKTMPRNLDIKLLQDTLADMGALIFRDEERKQKEEARAIECVREFAERNNRIITDKKIIDKIINRR